MKNRAVKLFPGKIIFDNARLPRTSYRWQTYRTPSGKLRRRRAEKRPEFYRHSSTPQQQRYGLHYRKGQLRLRTINQTDIRAFTNHNARKARPIAAAAMKGYIDAIDKAVKHFRNIIIAEGESHNRYSSNYDNHRNESQSPT